MKKIFVILVCLLILSNCKKDSNPIPVVVINKPKPNDTIDLSTSSKLKIEILASDNEALHQLTVNVKNNETGVTIFEEIDSKSHEQKSFNYENNIDITGLTKVTSMSLTAKAEDHDGAMGVNSVTFFVKPK